MYVVVGWWWWWWWYVPIFTLIICLSSQTRVVILQEPAADAEPCSMSFDPQGTYYRCAGVWIFSASDIPLSLKDFHSFSDAQNFVRRCAPFRDDSRFFLEHDILKCPRKENGFVSGAFNVQHWFLTDSHGIKQSVWIMLRCLWFTPTILPKNWIMDLDLQTSINFWLFASSKNNSGRPSNYH